MSKKALHSPNSRNPTTPLPTKVNLKEKSSVESASGRGQSQLKKVTRRSSRPIINWFQRKLAGTGKARRTSPALPDVVRASVGRSRPTPGSSLRERVVSSPSPPVAVNGAQSETVNPPRRKTISLDDTAEYAKNGDGEPERRSTGSSMAFESIWSPASALEADDDASVRPIPPSIPPSPSPSVSRSSLSYLSNPHTFKSLTASTKPTTLLSVDLTPNGMAHIAQAPATPSNHLARLSTHTRMSSNGAPGVHVGSAASITFSALPPPSPQSSRPSSMQRMLSNGSAHQSSAQGHHHIATVQAPLHTTHHPRNNPRPSSPPLDNASMLTLASSAFALRGSHISAGSHGWSSAALSVTAGDSTSHLGSMAGDADGDNESILVDEDRDMAASVRALRPRSSRRGSWDSEVSRWSARIGQGGAGAPSLVRSLWTANSAQTGGQFDGDPESEEEEEHETEKDSAYPQRVCDNESDAFVQHETPDDLFVEKSALVLEGADAALDDVQPRGASLGSSSDEAEIPHEIGAAIPPSEAVAVTPPNTTNKRIGSD